MAVMFVTKMENGQKATKGLCLKCAKEMGVPVDNLMGNVMNQLGISPDDMENMEEEISNMLEQQSETGVVASDDSDEKVDGGAPAIDLNKLFRDVGLMADKGASHDQMVPTDGSSNSDRKSDKKKAKEAKKL